MIIFTLLILTFSFGNFCVTSLPFDMFMHENNKEPTDNSDNYDYYDNFFDFANKKTQDLKTVNEKLFNHSLNSCEYAPQTTSKNVPKKRQCLEKTTDLKHLDGLPGTRLFMLDDLTIGLISSPDLSLSFYQINSELSVTLLNAEYFRNKVPFDACADKWRHVYVLFPDQYMIRMFSVNDDYSLSKIKSITELNTASTSIACHNDLIYSNDREHNQVRVYDKDLNLIEVNDVSGVVLSMHNALSVDKNVQVFVDGLDGVAMFNKDLKNNVKACHFYMNMLCIEDVEVHADRESKSSIYVTDSCDGDIKKFVFKQNERIVQEEVFKIGSGLPVSAVRNELNHLIVLTNYPSRINVFDLNKC